MTTYVLPDEYARAGWQLIDDGYGWVYAAHPVMGKTRSSFPAKHRGLKYILLAIDKLQNTEESHE